jgi:signal transduction histidine kinase
MSYSFVASSDFASLCQSQMALLTQGFGAVWSAVYLTEELAEERQAKLLPFAIYPQTDDKWQQELLPAVRLPENWRQLTTTPVTNLLPPTTHKQTEAQAENTSGRQLILPLLYEDSVLGLLVTGRGDRDWQARELEQVEKIARTIAIARWLERRQEWYKQELINQQNLRHLERAKLENLLHQLRNPITALRTFSKLLIKRFLPEEKESSISNSMLRESDRLQELLEQFEAENLDPVTLKMTSTRLLESASNDTNNLLLPATTFTLEAVDVREILQPLLIAEQAISEERGIELTSNLPESIPLVSANLKGLREVLNNLIDNALKYTPAGGKIEVSICEGASLPLVGRACTAREGASLSTSGRACAAREDANMLGVAIQDTGYGILPQDRERIFERRYRGIQANSNIPGSGLGLAIAKELVEQMSGSIELISPNDLDLNTNYPGTTFIVWLKIF